MSRRVSLSPRRAVARSSAHRSVPGLDSHRDGGARGRQGWSIQPHTSAGRVPPDLGYRSTSTASSSTPRCRRGRAAAARHAAAREAPRGGRLAQVSRVLADVTTEVGMALAPASQERPCSSIHFVRSAPHRVLAVVVTAGGLVDSRLLAVERDFSTGRARAHLQLLHESFVGLTAPRDPRPPAFADGRGARAGDELLPGCEPSASERSVATPVRRRGVRRGHGPAAGARCARPVRGPAAALRRFRGQGGAP